MTPEERQRLIESYGGAYAELAAGLQWFPEEMWDFRDAPGCWSIREHLMHLADSEVHSYLRCRRFIAEPGRPLPAYDENRWAAALDYARRDPRPALELFRLLRRQTYDLIKTLPESAWAHACRHPENGEMTLDDWLAVYAAHIPEHLSYMQQTYDAWQQTRSD